MSHTREPWVADGAWNIRQQSSQEILASCNSGADALRIVTCVNWCEGLNPAAYRELLEAVKAVRFGYAGDVGHTISGWKAVEQALAHAEQKNV